MKPPAKGVLELRRLGEILKPPPGEKNAFHYPPDNPGIAVNYLHLLRLERMGTVEFLPEKVGKTYNVKELLEGIKPVQERQQEMEQFLRDGKITDGKIEINLQQIQHTQTHVHTEVNVEVSLAVELPVIREDFADLKELLERRDPGLSRALREIMDSLDEVTPKSSPEKLSKPMNKLGRFLLISCK